MSYSDLIRNLPRALALMAIGFLALANGVGVAQDVEIGDVGESCWDRCNMHYGHKIANGEMSYAFAEAMFGGCVDVCECMEDGESVC